MVFLSRIIGLLISVGIYYCIIEIAARRNRKKVKEILDGHTQRIENMSNQIRHDQIEDHQVFLDALSEELKDLDARSVARAYDAVNKLREKRGN